MGKRRRIVVLGNLPLATRVLKLLQNREDVYLVGAVHPGIEKEYPLFTGDPCVATYCKLNNVRSLSLADVVAMKNLDLAISARNDQILSLRLLNEFSLGVVNCHGGFLPDYRGVGGHIFPIVNGESHTGATIHWMTEAVDRGPIIGRKRIPIDEKDDAVTLFDKINAELYLLVEQHLDAILDGTAPSIPQEVLGPNNYPRRSRYYYKADIKALEGRQSKNRLVQRALARVSN